MAAVALNAEFAAGAPDFAADEILRPLDDHAGKVTSRRARPNRMRHAAQQRLYVARIDAGAFDLDDRGALRDGFRPVDFDQTENRVEPVGAGRLRLHADGEGVGGIVHGQSPSRESCSFRGQYPSPALAGEGGAKRRMRAFFQ